jgi:cytochrome c oxidase cbb3-type subunit 1
MAATAHLTLLGNFRDTLWFDGVFGLAAFGALYFIVPRLAGRAWPSAALAQAHFGASLAGLALLLVAFGVGGATQGKMLNSESVAFLDITKALLPWFTARSVALMVLLVGQLALAVNFFLLLRQAYCPITGDSNPVTFNPPPALAMPAAPAEARH